MHAQDIDAKGLELQRELNKELQVVHNRTDLGSIAKRSLQQHAIAERLATKWDYIVQFPIGGPPRILVTGYTGNIDG